MMRYEPRRWTAPRGGGYQARATSEPKPAPPTSPGSASSHRAAWGDLHEAIYAALVDHPHHCKSACCEFSHDREVAFGDLVSDVADAVLADLTARRMAIVPAHPAWLPGYASETPDAAEQCWRMVLPILSGNGWCHRIDGHEGPCGGAA